MPDIRHAITIDAPSDRVAQLVSSPKGFLRFRGSRGPDDMTERPTCEIHRPDVTPAHDGIEFVVGDSHHQIAPNDSAAHPTAVQEGEAAEHLAFGDVVPSAERLANPIRKARRTPSILKLTVSHLLAVMARVEFHEAHVVLNGHGAEDGRSYPLAV